jgi:hypothetical protein
MPGCPSASLPTILNLLEPIRLHWRLHNSILRRTMSEASAMSVRFANSAIYRNQPARRPLGHWLRCPGVRPRAVANWVKNGPTADPQRRPSPRNRTVRPLRIWATFVPRVSKSHLLVLRTPDRRFCRAVRLPPDYCHRCLACDRHCECGESRGDMPVVVPARPGIDLARARRTAPNSRGRSGRKLASQTINCQEDRIAPAARAAHLEAVNG